MADTKTPDAQADLDKERKALKADLQALAEEREQFERDRKAFEQTQARQKKLTAQQDEQAHGGQAAPTVRVKMLQASYQSEMADSPRIAAGSVLDVDPETAHRWVNRAGIAEYAPDEQTSRAKRREELEAELAKLGEA